MCAANRHQPHISAQVKSEGGSKEATGIDVPSNTVFISLSLRATAVLAFCWDSSEASPVLLNIETCLLCFSTTHLFLFGELIVNDATAAILAT